MKLLKLTIVLLATFSGLNASNDRKASTTYITTENGSYLAGYDEEIGEMLYLIKLNYTEERYTFNAPKDAEERGVFNVAEMNLDLGTLTEIPFSDLSPEQQKIPGIESEIVTRPAGTHLLYLIRREVENCDTIEMNLNCKMDEDN